MVFAAVVDGKDDLIDGVALALDTVPHCFVHCFDPAARRAGLVKVQEGAGSRLRLWCRESQG